MTDVTNKAKDLLDLNYVVSIQGKVYKHGEIHFDFMI